MQTHPGTQFRNCTKALVSTVNGRAEKAYAINPNVPMGRVVCTIRHHLQPFNETTQTASSTRLYVFSTKRLNRSQLPRIHTVRIWSLPAAFQLFRRGRDKGDSSCAVLCTPTRLSLVVVLNPVARASLTAQPVCVRPRYSNFRLFSKAPRNEFEDFRAARSTSTAIATLPNLTTHDVTSSGCFPSKKGSLEVFRDNALIAPCGLGNTSKLVQLNSARHKVSLYRYRPGPRAFP